MKEELTSAMHSEFSITPQTVKRHDAFAVFQMVSERITLSKALEYLNMRLEDVKPYVAEWNGLSPKQIVLE